MSTKAFALLLSNKSVAERATKYVDRIKKSLELKIINTLEEEIETMEDQVFDLENFNLDTNLNKGQKEMTKEDCESRFESIINLRYKIDLKKAELKSKKAAFNALFVKRSK